MMTNFFKRMAIRQGEASLHADEAEMIQRQLERLRHLNQQTQLASQNDPLVATIRANIHRLLKSHEAGYTTARRKSMEHMKALVSMRGRLASIKSSTDIMELRRLLQKSAAQADQIKAQAARDIQQITDASKQQIEAAKAEVAAPVTAEPPVPPETPVPPQPPTMVPRETRMSAPEPDPEPDLPKEAPEMVARETQVSAPEPEPEPDLPAEAPKMMPRETVASEPEPERPPELPTAIARPIVAGAQAEPITELPHRAAKRIALAPPVAPTYEELPVRAPMVPVTKATFEPVPEAPIPPIPTTRVDEIAKTALENISALTATVAATIAKTAEVVEKIAQEQTIPERQISEQPISATEDPAKAQHTMMSALDEFKEALDAAPRIPTPPPEATPQPSPEPIVVPEQPPVKEETPPPTAPEPEQEDPPPPERDPTPPPEIKPSPAPPPSVPMAEPPALNLSKTFKREAKKDGASPAMKAIDVVIGRTPDTDEQEALKQLRLAAKSMDTVSRKGDTRRTRGKKGEDSDKRINQLKANIVDATQALSQARSLSVQRGVDPETDPEVTARAETVAILDSAVHLENAVGAKLQYEAGGKKDKSLKKDIKRNVKRAASAMPARMGGIIYGGRSKSVPSSVPMALESIAEEPPAKRPKTRHRSASIIDLVIEDPPPHNPRQSPYSRSIQPQSSQILKKHQESGNEWTRRVVRSQGCRHPLRPLRLNPPLRRQRLRLRCPVRLRLI